MNTQPQTFTFSDLIRNLACLAVITASIYLCYTIFITNQTFNTLQKPQPKPYTEIPLKRFYKPITTHSTHTLSILSSSNDPENPTKRPLKRFFSTDIYNPIHSKINSAQQYLDHVIFEFDLRHGL